MPSLFDLPFEETGPDAGPEVRPDAPPAPPIYSVSALTAAIRDALEERFGDVWVEGEVSNCRLWNSGILYLTLKDAEAQIKAVMFRSAVRQLKFKVEDGLHVLARGRVAVYEPKGEYQLVCEHLEPRGLGALQLALEQLKKRLAAEGLFDPGRKRPLPALPRKIGVVTSLDGAAIRDIIKVLRRRYANAHVVVRPARVQGEGAAEDVAAGLKAIARVPGVDVVIVGRGGGALEDLWAFNEEVVARAIAACPVPVISAVGHEADWTIADLVADVRAATPSNAAELVVARKDEFVARIDRLASRLAAAVRLGLDRRRAIVHALESRRGLATVPVRLALRGRRVAELAAALHDAVQQVVAARTRRLEAVDRRLEAHDPRRRLAAFRTRLVAAATRLGASAARHRAGARSRLEALAGRLDALSPLGVLARGYALCWAADGRTLLREARPDLIGTGVRVRLFKGELRCEVREALPDTSAGRAPGAADAPSGRAPQ
jgi:exodeoxyribonuclease VII large subunit